MPLLQVFRVPEMPNPNKHHPHKLRHAPLAEKEGANAAGAAAIAAEASERAASTAPLALLRAGGLPQTCHPRVPTHMPRADRSVYTKLFLFGLGAFSRLVYLDADTVVVRGIDGLFACGGFCAALRHSERFNSGVMVVEPSPALLRSMLARVHRTSSYTG